MGVEEKQLQAFLEEGAEKHGVPGIAVGIYNDGEEHYAFHGVTSIDNPLPVDERTLFLFGSTFKTFTATAMMRLVEQGKVELDAKVRKYIPELKLKDEQAARDVTILQLFNHTAGWQGDFMETTGEGDDALAKYVEKMAEVEQTTPLGTAFAYNNAAVNLAGRVIEKVTGKTYEKAMKELLFEPLGLQNIFFFPNEVMTRKFAVGHKQDPNTGEMKIARPWAMARAGAASGGSGVCSNAGDLIKWGLFHLGDGRANDGTQVLSEELLKKMQEPTFEMPGSALGDAVGISWFLRDIEGVRVVFHGGDVNGQHSEFKMIPERNFVISMLTNCDLPGFELMDEVEKWAFENYLGIVEKEPEPIKLSDEQLEDFVGDYETRVAAVHITAKDGGLLLKVDPKQEAIDALTESGEDVPPDYPPFPLGFLPGEEDRYIITEGIGKGMKGFFVRDDAGKVEAVHVGGRLATRTSSAS
jgi:CubicO group peptidase (beta-lactamase class C family)